MLLRLLFSQYLAKAIKLLKELSVGRVLPIFVGDLVLVFLFVCLLLFDWDF